MPDNIRVTISGYTTDKLIDSVADQVFHDSEAYVRERVQEAVARKITEQVDKQIAALVKREVNAALKKGVVTSDRFDGEEVRKPLATLVKDAVAGWLTARGSYNKESKLDKMMEEIIDRQVSRETEAMLKEVKNNAIQDARTNIAKVVSVKLFDGKALPL